MRIPDLPALSRLLLLFLLVFDVVIAFASAWMGTCEQVGTWVGAAVRFDTGRSEAVVGGIWWAPAVIVRRGGGVDGIRSIAVSLSPAAPKALLGTDPAEADCG